VVTAFQQLNPNKRSAVAGAAVFLSAALVAYYASTQSGSDSAADTTLEHHDGGGELEPHGVMWITARCEWSPASFSLSTHDWTVDSYEHKQLIVATMYDLCSDKLLVMAVR
jgi:hypothetical protein